jgi:hypothetical protein
VDLAKRQHDHGRPAVRSVTTPRTAIMDACFKHTGNGILALIHILLVFD